MESMQKPNSEMNPTSQDVSEGIKMARRAFIRDFPSLLADRKTKGKYVCYRKDKLVAVTKDYRTMLREIAAKDYPDDEWLIIKVSPGAGREQQEFEDEAEINPD